MELRTFDSSPATVVSDGGGGDSPCPGSPSEAPHPPRSGTSVGTGHDNDNDIVTRNGASNNDGDDGNVSPHGDAESRVRVDGDNGSSPYGEAGRRVRLVGLLGDLDLEVEFCSPHAPLPPSPVPDSGTEENEHNAIRRGSADEEGVPIGEVSWNPARVPTPASSLLASRSTPPSSSDQVLESGVGPALSLPAPARAKRIGGDDRSAGSGLEPSLWRAGEKIRARTKHLFFRNDRDWFCPRPLEVPHPPQTYRSLVFPASPFPSSVSL